MSKVEMMLIESAVRAQVAPPRALRPPKPPPPHPPAVGSLLRWVRQGARAGLWKPWWLLGLVEVVTYPYPRFRASAVRYEPGIRASCGLPAREGFWMEAAA